MFLSILNQQVKATDKPVVMFKEAAAGAPPRAGVVSIRQTPARVRLSARSGAEDRQATHRAVLAQTGNEIARIDENDRPVSADADLKESSEPPVAPVAAPARARPSVSGATPAPAR